MGSYTLDTLHYCMDKTLVSCEYLAASSKFLLNHNTPTHINTHYVWSLFPHMNSFDNKLGVYWTIFTQHFNADRVTHCIFTPGRLCFTLLTLWTHGAHPPLSSRDNCLSAGHCTGQVHRGDGNWFCLGLVSARYQHQLAARSRKVGGMKCAGDLAVCFNRVFYDFLISYVRKMQRRM